MFNESFLSSIADLASPRMGTEGMGPFLYSLVRMLRPRSVLEVGIGYSTPFILKALDDNVSEIERELNLVPDKNRLLSPDALSGTAVTDALNSVDKATKVRWLVAAPPLADPAFYEAPYRPSLTAIDDLSSPHATARKLKDRVESLPGAQYLNVVKGSFRGQGAAIASAAGGLDFMWFDCGGHREYRDFLDEYWPLLDANGGTLLLHYTLTNLTIGSIVKDLKIKQATTGFSDFELLSLREPHKMMQNSVSVVRKTSGFRDRIYYEIRDVSLESD
ncbi:MAG: hypothetical protein WC829_00720 [Hyphomicrobium sp.]